MPMDPIAKQRIGLALRISLIYAVLGGLWIYFSDGILGMFVSIPEILTRLQMIKGWGYVLITALMLYLIVNRGVLRIQRTEAALCTAEGKYRELVEEANSIMVRMDSQGTITFVNDYAERFFGYGKEALIGKPVVGTVLPEKDSHGRSMHETMQRLLHDPERYAGNVNENIRSNGERVWIAWTNRVIRDSENRVVEILGIGNDITREKLMGEALIQSNRRFREILETIHLISMMLDTEGKITFCNDYLLNLTGWKRDEVLDKSWFELFLPADVAETVGSLFVEGVLNGKLSRYHENEIITRAGERRVIAWNNTILRDVTGKVIGTTSVGEDVTERKKAQEALRIERDKLKSILDSMPEGALIMNRRGEVEYANPSVQAEFGHLTSGTTCSEYVNEAADVCEQLCKNDKVLDGKNVRFEWHSPGRGKAYDIFQTRLTNFDGSNSTLSFLYDITARVRSEEQVRFQAQLLDSVQEAVIATGLDSRITYWGKGAEALFGYHADDALGTPVTTLIDLDDTLVAKQTQTALTERYWVGQVMKRRKDGSEIWADTHISRVSAQDGKPVGFVAISRDITDARRTQKEREKLQGQLAQAQKMEAVGQLAGGVAHDFNNMLGVILGHAELVLEQTPLGDPRYPDLQEIHKAGRHSADLTRQLLAFARKQPASPKVLDLNDTVSGTIKMLHRLIGEAIELIWKPGYCLWSVKIDPSQVDQMLANLAINARDAISGIGKITIETANTIPEDSTFADRPEFVPGEYVLLTVSDDGEGMEREVLDHIFEPFFTTKKVGKGTGLGLATVYGIVKQNRGFVYVESKPGHGTAFKIYLPRHRGEAGDLPLELPAAPPPAGTETVLLVEDEPAMMKLGERILTRLGYTVLTAGTPEMAIRIAKGFQGEIQLLITDVIMPEMNGKQLAQRLTAANPRLKCLFMSGYTADVIAHHGVLNQGVHFITKPFSVTEMANKVREALAD